MAGWGIAIAGDMPYYAVLALTTLLLNSHISAPNITMLIVLATMELAPMLVRTFDLSERSLFNKYRSAFQKCDSEQHYVHTAPPDAKCGT